MNDFNDDDLVVRPGDKVIGFVPGRTKVEIPPPQSNHSLIAPTVVLACLTAHFDKTEQFDKLAKVKAIAKKFRSEGWFPERPEHEV